ncbi:MULTISPECIES: hypothetical protein [Streptomyces]|uniref:Uncharacterized protein n=1 Tax=Streptomyces olivaceiscleroticus TaxID=68245 RepID=A0ABN1BB24_9ACTN|nr:hypothetical protein [Streptomyces niger]
MSDGREGDERGEAVERTEPATRPADAKGVPDRKAELRARVREANRQSRLRPR